MESNYSVILECIYRPKVATALWYSLSWVDDNDRTYKVEAQDFTLLMWRAIQKHREQTILQDMDFLPQFNHQDGSGI